MSVRVCSAGISNCRCTVSIKLADDISLCFVRLPKGEFMMGARGYRATEEPVHRVVIDQDFYLGTTPVTQRQARVFMQSAGVAHKNQFDGHDNRPVENVSAEDADAFCAWLQQHVRESGQQTKLLEEQKLDVRLPTEAEWEYACKYGSALDTEYHTGDGSAALAQAGWFAHGEEFGDGRGNSNSRTHAVAHRSPNAAGLYDMHGNVWECCLDGWDALAYCRRTDGVVNPFMPAEGDANRVIRGGSWDDSASNCRAASRFGRHPGDRYRFQGFRVGLFPVHSCQTKQTANQPAR